MGNTDDFDHRLGVDRKLLVIVAGMAVAGLGLILLTNLANNTMSGIRAFSTFQTNWTQTRKDAVLKLSLFIEDEYQSHYDAFQKDLEKLQIARDARLNMISDESSDAEIHKLLVKAGNPPDDADYMISDYRWFGSISYFKDGFLNWEKSDSLVVSIAQIADQAQTMHKQGKLQGAQKAALIQQLLSIDSELTNQQHKLTDNLRAGMETTRWILWLSILVLGAILVVIGILFVIRFRKSLTKWKRTLEEKERRYRSLFDHNPNAVYSLNSDGYFYEGNQALKEMFGYSIEELKNKNFAPLVSDGDRKQVQGHFKKALEGKAQHYEVVGKHKNGTPIHVDVTNLPIYQGDEIVGVYGIAQDITDRVKAENKVLASLKDKELLLSEIHHRVKNNLAIISGLLQLQADSVKSEQARKDLLNTQSRIHSMAIVHEKLYQSDTLSEIPMDEYIVDLAVVIRDMFASGNTDIKMVTDIDNVSFNIMQAVPCGLLLNELIVNAYKYAFKGRDEGEILVQLEKDDSRVKLVVQDDGVGLPDDFDIDELSSLGMSLVHNLSMQLGANLDIEREHGTRFELNFDLEEGDVE